MPGGVGTPLRSAASPAESALPVAKCRCAEWGDGLDRPSSLHCSSLISASRSASCSSNTRTRSLSACSCRASSAAPTFSSSDEGCSCCASPCALLRGSLQTAALEHLLHVARCCSGASCGACCGASCGASCALRARCRSLRRAEGMMVRPRGRERAKDRRRVRMMRRKKVGLIR